MARALMVILRRARKRWVYSDLAATRVFFDVRKRALAPWAKAFGD
jgi:hypothetical protein